MTQLFTYRFASWDSPLWVQPNRSSARFNRAGSGPTQYLCLHPLGPWAEYLRKEDYTSIDDLLEIRARVWVLRIHEPDVFDLTFDTAEQLGIPPAELIADEYGPCQELADRCRNEPNMPKALRVPSAALPGTKNIVVFGPRVMAPYSAEPIQQIDVPTSITAEGGRPLSTLVKQVRYLGNPHEEFKSWEHGEPFRFVEPSTK